MTPDYTQQLESIDRRLETLSKAVDDDREAFERNTKAQNERIEEKERLRKRSTLALAIALGVLAFALVAGLVLYKRTSDATADATHDRRTADCRSMGDVAGAIKEGAAAIVPPSASEALSRYDAAIDQAFAKAKAKKGYSADCSVIGEPPG